MLSEVIAADPAAALGPAVAAAYGARLPFLTKLLAASSPLSLQVHPGPADAAAGFRRETAAGVPPGAGERSYSDDSHKPEMLLALTRFEGLAGFRDVERSAYLLRLLDLPWADQMAERLLVGAPDVALREVVTATLATPEPDLSRMLGELAEAAAATESRLSQPPKRRRPPQLDPGDPAREPLRVMARTRELLDRYPHDPGVLVTLLLNHVVLAPGEALFIEAGIVHAYATGFGVEVMAASDNVLRAGLTPKHVDIPELLAITDFRPIPSPVLRPLEASAGDPIGPGHSDQECLDFAPPVSEFRLRVRTVGAETSDLGVDAGPRVVLALDGEVHLATADAVVDLTPGGAAWLAHADGAATVSGPGRFALVSVPRSE